MSSSRFFKNLHPHAPHRWRDVLRWKLGLGQREISDVSPAEAAQAEPRPVQPDWSRIRFPDAAVLQVTWIGHATFLLQLNGLNWLTDPVFSDLCAPLPLPQCRRLIPPGLAWERLPRIDGVLISHAHYDHLDETTLRRLDRKTPIFVPRALGPWFLRRGFTRIEEIGWWKSSTFQPGWTVHACPVQHFSARKPWDWNRTQWCGWILETFNWKVFFVGDSGYCSSFKDIGQKYSGLDLAILPIGAYAPRWLMKSMHTDPFEAAQVHLDLGTRYSVPGHWGTFRLTDEPPGEPAILLDQARQEYQISAQDFPLLQPGQTWTIVPKHRTEVS